MGIFSSRSRSGNPDEHVVKRAGSKAREQDARPADHGSRSSKVLLSGTGAIINWGRGGAVHIGVTGDGPGRRR